MHWLLRAPTTGAIYPADYSTSNIPKSQPGESGARPGSMWTTPEPGPQSDGASTNVATATSRSHRATKPPSAKLRAGVVSRLTVCDAGACEKALSDRYRD